MKVILSADPIRFPLTGIGRYTYELARGLQQAQLDDFLLLNGLHLQPEIPGSAAPADSVAASVAKPPAISARLLALAKKSRLAGMLYGAVDPWRKGRALRGREDYVFHGPNFYLPLFAGASVATIHDLSIYKWPETHPVERVRYMRRQIDKTMKCADFLITDTEYTRREVADYFSWPLERIRAVHLASAAEFYPRDAAELTPALQALGLQPGGYVLFTGTVEPRKNLQALLHAYELLPNALRLRFPLVISGYKGWRSDDLHQRMDTAQRAGWLKYLGFVDAQVLPLVMAGARLFAYPSLYEGFGLPVLEAMASGVPVICSDASTLPEVAGGAAALHKPDDVNALRDWLLRGLEDEGWCAEQRSAGLDRAAQFSWQRCVQETLDVYRQVVR